MGFHIEERFEVEAPLEKVWAFLIDPRRVVVCLPGAEVTDVIDEQTYEGRVVVKVGPVTARYSGTVRLEEADEAQYVVRLQGQGMETGGSGSARMSMTGRVVPAGASTTRVDVDAEIDVAGKMARFGRGVMEDVSRQLFREFARNTQERLARADEESSEAADATSTEAPPTGASSGETSRSTSESTQPLSLVTLVFRSIRFRLKRLFGG